MSHGQNQVGHRENKGLQVLHFSLSLGSLSPARETKLYLCSFQELFTPCLRCCLRGLERVLIYWMRSKDTICFSKHFFKAIYLGRLRGKNWPVLYLSSKTGAVRTVIKSGYWKRWFCQVLSLPSVHWPWSISSYKKQTAQIYTPHISSTA